MKFGTCQFFIYPNTHAKYHFNRFNISHTNILPNLGLLHIKDSRIKFCIYKLYKFIGLNASTKFYCAIHCGVGYRLVLTGYNALTCFINIISDIIIECTFQKAIYIILWYSKDIFKLYLQKIVNIKSKIILLFAQFTDVDFQPQ